MSITNWLRKIIGITDLSDLVKVNNRILNEINWANIFNNTIDGCEWLQMKNFSPGRWAVGYPMLYLLFRLLNEIKPNKILEFGLGESSVMLYRYDEFHKDSRVITFEHDVNWINHFKNRNRIPENASIQLIENIHLAYKNHQTLGIKNIENKLKGETFELIIVDAPFGSPNYSRIQILDLVPNNIDRSNFCIVIDDYNRIGEKETCIELQEVFNTNGIRFNKGVYYGLKDSVVYCSDNYKYFVSL